MNENRKLEIEKEIQEMVDRETKAWDTQNVNLLLTIFHPDFVWPFPPNPDAHDPLEWIFFKGLGRFDKKRWSQLYQNLFDTHQLTHNVRKIQKILLTDELDGALAVVDIDTLWIDQNRDHQHWKGRVCKVYSKVDHEWKITMHTGALNYS